MWAKLENWKGKLESLGSIYEEKLVDKNKKEQVQDVSIELGGIYLYGVVKHALRYSKVFTWVFFKP